MCVCGFLWFFPPSPPPPPPPPPPPKKNSLFEEYKKFERSRVEDSANMNTARVSFIESALNTLHVDFKPKETEGL